MRSPTGPAHGARETASDYAERVAIVASVPARNAAAFERELADGSGGVAVATRIEERLAPRA
ncbi:MAG: DUF1949 domain-containing protein [Candidatus Rokuibacteriota bacterium]